MQLNIGFSPCPNDTYMLEALVHGRVETAGITWQHYIEDVETLNTWALQGKLDVTKISFSAWLKVQDTYALLSAGAALGHGCGPLVIARRPLSDDDILGGSIAIPGELTTAHLLFSLRYPGARDKRFMLFSEIESAVIRGDVLAGVIIHENRFTYQSKGLVKILDLGEYWEELTGCPIPLGAFAAHKRLGSERHGQISQMIHASVRHAFDHPDLAMPYVRSYAQEMDDAVMLAHIRTYVNEFSLDLGNQGNTAVKMLQGKAQSAGLI